MYCLPGGARHVRPSTPSDVFANALTSVPTARRRPQLLWHARHSKPCRMPLSASAPRRPLRNVLCACKLPASFRRVGERSPRTYAYSCPLHVTACTQPLLLCASAARVRERGGLQRTTSQCTSCSGAQLFVMRTNDAPRFSKEPLVAALLLLSGRASQLVAEMQSLLYCLQDAARHQDGGEGSGAILLPAAAVALHAKAASGALCLEVLGIKPRHPPPCLQQLVSFPGYSCCFTQSVVLPLGGRTAVSPWQGQPKAQRTRSLSTLDSRLCPLVMVYFGDGSETKPCRSSPSRTASPPRSQRTTFTPSSGAQRM